MDRQTKESLDRYLTREPPEEPEEDYRTPREQEIDRILNPPTGRKPAKEGEKCSYCDRPALEYIWSPSHGLNHCDQHGGRKWSKRQKRLWEILESRIRECEKLKKQRKRIELKHCLAIVAKLRIELWT